MNRLENKVILVTGGSLGIGKSAAVECARQGAQVAVLDILDKEGQNLVDEITENGGKANYWHLDVSNEEEVISIFSGIKKEYGKIDVLVNNIRINSVHPGYVWTPLVEQMAEDSGEGIENFKKNPELYVFLTPGFFIDCLCKKTPTTALFSFLKQSFTISKLLGFKNFESLVFGAFYQRLAIP